MSDVSGEKLGMGVAIMSALDRSLVENGKEKTIQTCILSGENNEKSKARYCDYKTKHTGCSCKVVGNELQWVFFMCMINTLSHLKPLGVVLHLI